jgi:hypothetical protein
MCPHLFVNPLAMNTIQEQLMLQENYRAFSRDVIAAMLVSHEQKISH